MPILITPDQVTLSADDETVFVSIVAFLSRHLVDSVVRISTLDRPDGIDVVVAGPDARRGVDRLCCALYVGEWQATDPARIGVPDDDAFLTIPYPQITSIHIY